MQVVRRRTSLPMAGINLLGKYFCVIAFWWADLFDRVIMTLCTGMLGFGSTIYWMVFLYAFFANAFFLVCPFLFLWVYRVYLKY